MPGLLSPLVTQTTLTLTNTMNAQLDRLVDDLTDQAFHLINAATEAGDIANAKALFEEWDEWITATNDDVIEVQALPIITN